MFNLFAPKVCLVCQEKERRLEEAYQQIATLKAQLAHSREREEKAVDALLARQDVASITPTPKLTAKDSENAYKEAFGIFIDADDDGSGNIVEVDQLSQVRLPQPPSA